jgi:hypothetical protein
MAIEATIARSTDRDRWRFAIVVNFWECRRTW